MPTNAGKRIIGSARQALAIAKGEADPATFRAHVPETVDVRAIRSKTGLTQKSFAVRYGLSLRTLQEWERGARSPEGPARALLVVIDREPEAVNRALAG